MASSSYNLYTIRHHSKDIQRAIQPQLDEIIDEFFLKRIISSEAYRQVISCSESERSGRLFFAIQSSVTRSVNNYDLLLQVLRDILPRERSRDLLLKLAATQRKRKLVSREEAAESGEVRRSASEPIMSPSKMCSRLVTSVSMNDERTTSGVAVNDRDEENGGLHFRNITHSDSNADLVGTDSEQLVVPVQECTGNGNIGREGDEFSAAVEESRRNESDPSSLKRRGTVRQSQQNGGSIPQVHQNVPEAPQSGASGILEAVFRWQNARSECQQRHAQVIELNREVKDLKGKLTSAHDENENLALKVQRQSEDIENLRRKQNRQISALRDEARNSEGLRTWVAELEVDRHALREKVLSISAQYEPRIRELENARSRHQRRIDFNDVEIPRLQNVIIQKEDKIKELCRSMRCLRCLNVSLIVLIFFLLCLVALLFWYLLG